MSNQIHIIQNAITTTISEIFRGDFRRICEVKKAVLHLEAIYFCHGTCYLLKRENMPIKDQLALYQRIELIPQSTTEFFENNRECIINNWPEESALAAKPEILYDALYWLFGEQYHLVTADKRMQKALEEYLYLLYGDKAPNPVLTPDEEELRRMDIFACAARNTEDANGSAIQENLVVELKAPKVVLTKAVLRQIEDYMDYVRKQPLFNSQYRRWKFIAVCSAVDDDVKARYDSQKSKGKKGLVAEIDNYEVYALTWDDVFQSFDLRHAFLLDKLKMDEEAIAAEIAQTAGDEKSKDTADALTALVAN